MIMRCRMRRSAWSQFGISASERFAGTLVWAAVFPFFTLPAAATDVAGVYQPVSVKDVEVRDPFWLPRLLTFRDHSISSGWQYVEGPLQELEHLATGTGPTPEGVPWTEANLYKFMEAAAYVVAQWPNQPDTLDPPAPGRHSAASLKDHLDAIIATMQAAEAKTDGYLHAFCVNHEGETLPWGIPISPWGHTGLHDGYVAGHLIEAAIAYHHATGSPAMLKVAKRVADQAYTHFITQQAPGFTEHAELELALIELYRVTGDSKYLDLSQHLVEQRGKTPSALGGTSGRAYCQDDLPARQQTSINGHAVRAVFFYTGVADLALAGRPGYRDPILRVWENTTRKKMYVTGGVGGWDTEELGEAFAPDDYHLINEHTEPGTGATCYCESCAAGGMVNFAHRIGRLRGEAESIDVLERVLYNSLLHGVSLDGRTTYYRNPLTDQDNPRNNIWVCCPPLLYRTLLGVGKYIYGYSRSDIYVNLFVGEFVCVSHRRHGGSADARNQSCGRVSLGWSSGHHRDSDDTGRFRVAYSIPGLVPGMRVELNGKVITDPQIRDGYVVINRQWSHGDKVVFTMTMTPTRIESHPNVTANAGRVCIQAALSSMRWKALTMAEENWPTPCCRPHLSSQLTSTRKR